MERLTIRNSDGSVSQPFKLKWAEAIEKLAAYEDAEEQGRFVVLPKDTKERIDKLEDLLYLSKSCLERKKKALEGME